MKISILTHDTAKNSPHKLIKQKGEERGHTVNLVSIDILSISSIESNPQLTQITDSDIVHYQATLGRPLAPAIISWLTRNNVTVVNSKFYSRPYVEDKRYETCECAQAGIPVPETIVAKEPTFETLAERLGTPFIIKQADSSRGRHVFLINSAEELADATKDLERIVYQQYIPSRSDYRILLMGELEPIIYRRTAAEKDFRANAAQGGKIEVVEDQEIRTLVETAARDAAKVLDLEFGGIDIIVDPNTNKPYFIEANRTPSLEHFSEILQIDVNDKVIDFYEQKDAH